MEGTTERVPIRTPQDVVLVRQRTRTLAAGQGLSLVDQTKVVTAASELARNTLEHGKGGEVLLEAVTNGVRRGIRLTFEDRGPGIPDVAAALRDGFTTGTGMGLGLPGARRLMNEFSIESTPGQGTRVVVARWK
ncbi:MAG TPA: anti-sigma regulatory factor [Myxococcaceae bacterium]|nr:anti-sigma regulatory factor [Myxococcaceae bacterium]